MATPRGRTLPISLPRRFIGDLLYFAKGIPTVPVQRTFNITPVVEARSALVQSISWVAIFIKAYGKVTQAFPELRRSFLSIPFSRIYEHPFSIASVAIERDYQGDRAVFFAHLRSPETQTLRALDGYLHRFKNEPFESIGLFRKAMSISRLPWPLRRLIWWLGLKYSGPKRAKRLGTFGVSVYSGLGAESLHPLSPLTTTLNYGVIQPNGTVAVRIIYDHRVMDGSTVARALAHLETVLNRDLVAELRGAGSEPHRTIPASGAA